MNHPLTDRPMTSAEASLYADLLSEWFGVFKEEGKRYDSRNEFLRYMTSPEMSNFKEWHFHRPVDVLECSFKAKWSGHDAYIAVYSENLTDERQRVIDDFHEIIATLGLRSSMRTTAVAKVNPFVRAATWIMKKIIHNRYMITCAILYIASLFIIHSF